MKILSIKLYCILTNKTNVSYTALDTSATVRALHPVQATRTLAVCESHSSCRSSCSAVRAVYRPEFQTGYSSLFIRCQTHPRINEGHFHHLL